MGWMSWKYHPLKQWILRNKLGLILGLIVGALISYLYWTKSTALSIETMTYLTYPLHLIFGCDVPFYGLIILTLIYVFVGICLDAIFSKWQIKDDRNRALIILAILIIVLGGIYYYKDVNNKLCFDTNRDGIPEIDLSCVTTADCSADKYCSNGLCITNITYVQIPCQFTSSTCLTWSQCSGGSQYCISIGCSSLIRSCGTTPQCTTNSQCNSGKICINNSCVTNSTSGIDFEITIS